MKSHDAQEFFKIGVMLGRITEYLSTGTQGSEKVKTAAELGDKDKESLTTAITKIRDQASEIGAKITALAAADLLKKLTGKATYVDLREGIQDIQSTLVRETSTVAFYTVSSEMSGLVTDCDKIFGQEFQSSFPSSIYDLEEACRCIAMSRFTAGVFHLMRIMEVLLRAVHACLSLPPPTGADKNWGNMLGAIKSDMNTRNQNANAGWKNKDRQFFEDLYASIDAVRVAWRNTTMHVERRYDEDEAQHLLHVVKALAKKLAQRCDETGDPKA